MKYLIILSVIFLTSCNNVVDIEKEKSQIITLIDLVRQAHLEKNAQKFYQPNAEQWIDIRNGEISKTKKVDRISSTQNYLDNMEFLQLDALGNPIIEISNDATLATYSSKVLVKGELSGTSILWIVAWQNVLKKIDNEWKIISSVNTEATKEVSAKVVLSQVRSNLGNIESLNSISALADCVGPEGNNFTTLIYSKKDDGRMEQLSGERHSIFKHGEQSWGKNIISGNLHENLVPNFLVFAKSHELHWLSTYPEDRYANAHLEGIVDFKGQKVFKIGFTDDANNPVNFYYDFKSYLPLAFDIVIDDKGNTVTTYFENWNEQDGVKLFSNATFDQGGTLYKYQFSELKLNSLKEGDFESKEARIIL